MSLENDISRIATALETIATCLSSKGTPVQASSATVQTVQEAIVQPSTTIPLPPVVTAPVATLAVAPVIAPAPVVHAEVFSSEVHVAERRAANAPTPFEMPPPPFAIPAATTVPFSDAKSLAAYVMTSYKALGSVKGAKIQEVLIALGYQNINDVQPEKYAALYAGIEALKL